MPYSGKNTIREVWDLERRLFWNRDRYHGWQRELVKAGIGISELEGIDKTCEQCEKQGLCFFGPDPYAHEIHDNDTPLWQCTFCYRESCDEI